MSDLCGEPRLYRLQRVALRIATARRFASSEEKENEPVSVRRAAHRCDLVALLLCVRAC
jgi:hypothetical protein